MYLSALYYEILGYFCAPNFKMMNFLSHDYIYTIEIIAMGVYGFTGVLALKPERNDLINVILLGLIAATGGGAVRDVLLGRPAFFIKDVNYLIAPIVPSMIVFYFYPLAKRIDKLLAYLDGIGLALFVASASSSVLNDGYDPIIAITMGVITGVFGGILRDIVINRKPIVMGHTFYITPAVIGAILCVLISKVWNDQMAVLISFIVILGLRTASIYWKWYLPGFMLFQHAEDDKD